MALKSCLSFRRSVPSGVGGVELLLDERIRTRPTLIGELVVVSGMTRKCKAIYAREIHSYRAATKRLFELL